MILKKLVLENFLPFKGTQEVAFSIDPKKNVTIIHAPNTYGKTSLLRSIKWVLYGRILHKNDKEFELLNIINKQAADESNYSCKVILEFEDKGSEYKLIRQFDSKKPFPQHDSDFDQDVNLYVDNIVQSGSQIEQIINSIAPEPVSRFFLFDGELLQEYQELLENESESGRKIKQSIEQILGIPALINGKIDLKILLDESRKNQNKDVKKQEELADLVNAIEGLNQANELKEKDIKIINTQLKEIRGEVEIIEKTTQDLDKKFREAIKIDSIKQKIDSLYNRQSELEDSKLDLASNAWKLLLKNYIKGNSDTNIKEKSESEIYEEIGFLKAEIKILSSTYESNKCVICDNKNFHLEDIGKIISDKEKQLEDIERNLENIKPSLNLILNTLDIGDRSIIDIYKELKSIVVSITEEENKLDELRDISSSDEDRELIKKNVERKGKLNQQALEIENQISEIESDIDRNNSQVNAIQARINQTTGGSKSSFTKYVEFYENMYRVFDESINNLRDRLKMEVQKNASKAFVELTHRKNYKSLEINDNYGLTIIDEEGNPVPARSAGAEQIVALSLIDGLSKTGSKSRPVVMDTPFGRLDDKHRSLILEYLPKSSSQLILFAHDGEVDNQILNTMRDVIGKEYEINLVADKKSSYIGPYNG